MNLVLRPIAVEDVDALQDLIESDPGYTERVTGYPPGPADAQSLLMMRPDGLAEDAKVVLGAFQDGRLVAVADLLRGFPDDHTAYIGLLEVHWNHQGLGIGRGSSRPVRSGRTGTTSWRRRRDCTRSS